MANKPTAKSIYFWNIAGSFSNALLSVIVLMIITRAMPATDADIFSLAWSISLLMSTIGTFQVRTYQATDVNGKYSFTHYLYFRFICLFLMITVSFIYIIYLKYDFYKSFIIFLLCVFRAIDCLADVYEGWFQQKERLDLSGIALTSRVLLCIILLLIITLLTKNLIFICISLILSYIFCFIFFDFIVYSKFFSNINAIERKYDWSQIKMLIKDTFPLFINAFLAMAITNIPKMSIDFCISQSILQDGSQIIFNVLFMPASFLTLAYIVFRPLITKMALMWNHGRYKEYFSILSRMFCILLGACIPIIIIAYWIGCPILSFFYGIDLSSYSWNLVIILLGGCFYTFACILDNALVIMRRQYTLVIAYGLTAVICYFLSDPLVVTCGITGAAYAYLLSMVLFFSVMFILFFVGYKREKKRSLLNDLITED